MKGKELSNLIDLEMSTIIVSIETIDIINYSSIITQEIEFNFVYIYRRHQK